MLLNTKRLILRLPKEADIPAYLAISNSNFVLRYNAMTVTTEEKVIQIFKEANEKENMLVMELAETGAVIGVICIEEDSIRWDVNSKELSYFLGEENARKGYMKEALSEVIRYLLETKGLSCISARSFVPNIASRKLLESLGFCLNGIIPRCVKGYGGIIFDDALYSIFPANN